MTSPNKIVPFKYDGSKNINGITNDIPAKPKFIKLATKLSRIDIDDIFTIKFSILLNLLRIDFFFICNADIIAYLI